MTLAPLGDTAVIVYVDGDSESARLDAGRTLAGRLSAERFPGFVDCVAAYASVTVFYDPAQVSAAAGGRPPFAHVCAEIENRLKARGVAQPTSTTRLVTLPVCYDPDCGPDLGEVAASRELAPAEIVRIHSGVEYLVAAVGFTPGFPYLAGLPAALHTPRRATPRTRVPAGSVAIGGSQTGVYPIDSPGGWNVIGRTPRRLFDPSAQPPALLQVGDRVRFQPITPGEFARQAESQCHVIRDISPAPGGERQEEPHVSRDISAGVVVLKPGMLSTVQDLGRVGAQCHGVTPGGAADAPALRLANLLVGNDEHAAGLEITLTGPTLRLTGATLGAICGAEFDLTVAGRRVPSWRPVWLPAGAELRFGAALAGCRAYLALAGGIAVPTVLGGKGTHLGAGFGGLEGRALRAGDTLHCNPPSDRSRNLATRLAGEEPFRAAGWEVGKEVRPPYSSTLTVRAVRGPQWNWFAADAHEGFGRKRYTVTPRSDRMGLRLTGEALTGATSREMVSEGVVAGAVQVPPDGQPIVLLADRQTIGGYPKIAAVATVDLPLLAQLRPGDSLGFREISLEEAHELWFAAERRLATVRQGIALHCG